MWWPSLKPEKATFVVTGHWFGIDHGVTYRDMLDWSMDDLQDRLDLVRAFDAACDITRSAFIRLLNEFMLIEQVVMVPQTVKRLERIC